jgi:hypothetical protein
MMYCDAHPSDLTLIFTMADARWEIAMQVSRPPNTGPLFEAEA